MEKVKIAGREVFSIGFGTWTLGDDPKTRNREIDALRAGIENGVQVIDTAEMYGNGASERAVAEAIEPYNREDLFLISKVLPENASKMRLVKSLDASLQRLKTDYLDHYLLHWKGSIPLIETVEALEKERQKGKIKSWGVSNLDTNEMRRVMSFENGKYCSSNQVRYNLGDRGIEFDLLPLMRKHGIPLIAYAPVAKGDKLGSKFSEEKVLKDLAEKYRCDVFQILLAWCVRDKRTIAIPQSGNRQHVISNLRAAQIEFSEEDLSAIDQIYPEPNKKQSLALW